MADNIDDQIGRIAILITGAGELHDALQLYGAALRRRKEINATLDKLAAEDEALASTLAGLEAKYPWVPAAVSAGVLPATAAPLPAPTRAAKKSVVKRERPGWFNAEGSANRRPKLHRTHHDANDVLVRQCNHCWNDVDLRDFSSDRSDPEGYDKRRYCMRCEVDMDGSREGRRS